MHRRRLLHALTAGLLTTGCLSHPAPTDRTTQPASLVTDGGTLSILSVETDATVVRLNDLGTSPGASITKPLDLDDREREVVESAIEGGYETDAVPDWLAKFASETPFVLADGDYYRLENTLPVYTITAEATSEDEVSGEIASSETYREAVTHDGLRTTGLMRIARRDGFRTGYVWPSLREFLDAYDAVHYRGDVLDFEETVDDPDPPYEITAEPTTLEEVARGPVWDVTDAPADVREVVRAAGSESGTYSLDGPPTGLLENLKTHEYVYLDGRFYTAYVENEDPHDVSLSADAIQPEGDDSVPRIRLALRNEADGSVRVKSGAPEPFGVLRCHPRDGPGTSHLLWTDVYEENRHVHTEGREVVGVNDIGVITTLAPGEAVDREFEIPSDLPPGEYVIDSGVGIEYADREGGSFSFRVIFRVE